MADFIKWYRFPLLFVIAAVLASAQSPLSSTTLSGGITAYSTVVCLASATNVTLPSLTSGTLGSILVTDAEAMQVQAAGPISTCFRVKRGLYANSASNAAAAHSSGAKVWVTGATVSTGDTSRPISTSAFLTQRPYHPFEILATPSLFGVSTTAVTDVAGKIWYGAVEADFSAFATGACILNGATVGTDKWIVALYDATGNLLANSALAGTTTAGASQYQCLAFTSPVALVGPAQYFLALQGNSTNDTFQSYGTGAAPTSYPTGTKTGGTFGVLPSLTVTTTYTAGAGPLMALY